MINEKLIPQKKDMKKIYEYIQAVRELDRKAEEYKYKKLEAEDRIEEINQELQDLMEQEAMDYSGLDIDKFKARRKKLLEEQEDQRVMIMFNLDLFIQSRLQSEEFKLIKSEAANEHEKVTRPLIEERDRLKVEYEQTMKRIDDLVFKSDYDSARKLEVTVKHKGRV
ncbi:hypothetical protein [Gudongella sp. DL1XJH-153]|uniref:hypothetical protein n=1 Tax=Gudongella sp. DL1XJH-153 TaxID=3409804 RepID=UPI003BB5783A